MKFAMKFEIQKDVKYDTCIKFGEVWNIVILLSDQPLGSYSLC